MSKKNGNYREPSEIFDKYGADALRWFFFSKQTPWTAIQYKEQAIKDLDPRVPAAPVECVQLPGDLCRNRRF